MALRLSVVIPTKNRPVDLRVAVQSIRDQTLLPTELVVVDQSEGPESREVVTAVLADYQGINLVYIHDTRISGLVEAKHVGSTRASGDVVCFLEDDERLEPDYLEQIADGFTSCPEMQGCSGVVMELPETAAWYVAAHRLFFRGIFRDPRVAIFARPVAGDRRLIPCDVLSGGLSAWRREVLTRVPFDTRNGFHFLEDMEFASRVVRTMGHVLRVNPRARLYHYHSNVNRDVHGARQRRKLTEAIVFYKKRRNWPGARLGLFLVAVWWLGEAVRQSTRMRSTGPVSGFFRGIGDGLRKPLVPTNGS